MNMTESRPRAKPGQFKEAALSYLNEIYGAALRLSNNEKIAEELTVRAYENVFRKNLSELRMCLHRELLKTYSKG